MCHLVGFLLSFLFSGIPFLPEGPQDGAGAAGERGGGHHGPHQASQLSTLGDIAPEVGSMNQQIWDLGSENLVKRDKT